MPTPSAACTVVGTPSRCALSSLVQRMELFVTRYNRTSTPFAWTATADTILAKLTRLAKAINGT